MKEFIKAAKIDKALPLGLHEQRKGDLGYDIEVSEGVIIKPGVPTRIGTNLSVEMPRWMGASLVPRSSTIMKHGLLLVTGTIDPGYRGEIGIVAINVTNEDVRLYAGMRIAQLIPVRQRKYAIEEVENLGETLRGTSGFGSTGI